MIMWTGIAQHGRFGPQSWHYNSTAIMFRIGTNYCSYSHLYCRARIPMNIVITATNGFTENACWAPLITADPVQPNAVQEGAVENATSCFQETSDVLVTAP